MREKIPQRTIEKISSGSRFKTLALTMLLASISGCSGSKGTNSYIQLRECPATRSLSFDESFESAAEMIKRVRIQEVSDGRERSSDINDVSNPVQITGYVTKIIITTDESVNGLVALDNGIDLPHTVSTCEENGEVVKHWTLGGSLSGLPMSGSDQIEIIVIMEDSDNRVRSQTIQINQATAEFHRKTVTSNDRPVSFVTYNIESDSLDTDELAVEKIKSIAQGIQDVSVVMQFAPVDTVGVFGSNTRNAFVFSDRHKNKIFFFSSIYFSNSPTELYYTSRHEVLHLLAQTMNYHTVLEDVHRKIGRSRYGQLIFDLIDEKGFYSGQVSFGGHSKDNSHELAASFLNLLMEKEKLPLVLASMDYMPIADPDYMANAKAETKQLFLEILQSLIQAATEIEQIGNSIGKENRQYFEECYQFISDIEL